jgi:hypothetical protein
VDRGIRQSANCRGLGPPLSCLTDNLSGSASRLPSRRPVMRKVALSQASGLGWTGTAAQPSRRAGRYWVSRSSRNSLSELCGRTSNKITRWPSHITTPSSSTTNSHTTSGDATRIGLSNLVRPSWGAVQMNGIPRLRGYLVSAAGKGVVPSAGTVTVEPTSNRAGLTDRLSSGLTGQGAESAALLPASGVASADADETGGARCRCHLGDRTFREGKSQADVQRRIEPS